ncbi:helix-turn-helix domain-containing protein [Proteus mirabilis]|uniref:helix-turn-helix domain-containing protein n=1 Tax=Proteus mirabilis TaxID=584 RepID=UPI0039B4A554
MKNNISCYSKNELFYKMGSEIKRLRIKKGLTGAELGKLINLSQQQISRYERGLNCINMAKLLDILHALDTSPLQYMMTVFKETPPTFFYYNIHTKK